MYLRVSESGMKIKPIFLHLFLLLKLIISYDILNKPKSVLMHLRHILGWKMSKPKKTKINSDEQRIINR